MTLTTIASVSLLVPDAALLAFMMVTNLILVSALQTGTTFFTFPTVVVFTLFNVGGVVSGRCFSNHLTLSDRSSGVATLICLRNLRSTRGSLGRAGNFKLKLRVLNARPPSVCSSVVTGVANGIGGRRGQSSNNFLTTGIITRLKCLNVCLVFTCVLCYFGYIQSVEEVLLGGRLERGDLAIVSCYVAVTFSIRLFIEDTNCFSPRMFVFLVSAFCVLRRRGSLAGQRLVSHGFRNNRN